MDIKNYICPVCNNSFNDTDDAVFCPECGTPHHRECWNKTGKCFNEVHHGEEGIESTYKNPAKRSEIKKPEEPLKEEIKEEKKLGPISLEIKEDDLRINHAQTFLIDGKPSVLYDVAVRKNQKYYIPHFMMLSERGKKSFAWNFWAFLVPLAWSVYRKMYKFSAIILALYMVILGVNGYYIFSDEGFMAATNACIEEDPNYLENITLYLSDGDVSLTPNQQKLIEEMGQIYVPTAFSTVSSLLLIGCRIFMGLKANSEYMKLIKKTIEKGEKAGLSGDKLKMYIYRKRGYIPIFIPAFIAIFEWLTIY